MNPEGAPVDFASDQNVVYTSINIRKKISTLLIITFVSIKTLTKNHFISATIETVKQLHAVFMLTVE